MDRLVSDRTVTVASKGLAAALVVASAAGTVGLSLQSGLSGLASGLPAVYLALVLAVGVFRDTLSAPRLQVALWVGVVAVALQLYLSERDLLTLAVLAVGALVLAARLRRVVGSRTRPL